MPPTLEHEKMARETGFQVIAGIDEAGRGPWAGPVVAGAVILPEGFYHDVLNDSKKLNEHERDELYGVLTSQKDILWAFGIASHEEIDRLNILQATYLAMRRAVESLPVRADFALIDGRPVKNFPLPHKALVKGDSLSFSIAAASIIAKVTRDRLMLDLHREHPSYNFARHKGYGTPEHQNAIKIHGICPIHRRSFAPIREALARGDDQGHR